MDNDPASFVTTIPVEAAHAIRSLLRAPGWAKDSMHFATACCLLSGTLKKLPTLETDETGAPLNPGTQTVELTLDDDDREAIRVCVRHAIESGNIGPHECMGDVMMAFNINGKKGKK